MFAVKMRRAGRTRPRRRQPKGWLRAFLLLLVIPIALAQWAPVFARLVVPAVHICHCDRNGPEAECDCPLCNPDRGDLASSDVAVRGVCGDEKGVSCKALFPPAVVPAGWLFAPFSSRAETQVPFERAGPERFVEPPTPPPRSV